MSMVYYYRDRRDSPTDWWRGDQDIYEVPNGIDGEREFVLPYDIENPVVLLNSKACKEGEDFYFGRTRSSSGGFTKTMVIFKYDLKRGDLITVRRGLPPEEIATGRWDSVKETVAPSQTRELERKISAADEIRKEVDAGKALDWKAGKRKIQV